MARTQPTAKTVKDGQQKRVKWTTTLKEFRNAAKKKWALGCSAENVQISYDNKLLVNDYDYQRCRGDMTVVFEIGNSVTRVERPLIFFGVLSADLSESVLKHAMTSTGETIAMLRKVCKKFNEALIALIQVQRDIHDSNFNESVEIWANDHGGHYLGCMLSYLMLCKCGRQDSGGCCPMESFDKLMKRGWGTECDCKNCDPKHSEYQKQMELIENWHYMKLQDDPSN